MTQPSRKAGRGGCGRSGRSRRAVLAHLGAKGVAATLADAAAPEDEAAEFMAALAFARGGGGWDPSRGTASPRIGCAPLAAFGRAGFSGAMARRALECDPEEAQDSLRAQPPE